MGFLAWLVIGIVAALAARKLLTLVLPDRAAVPVAAVPVGSVIGGFVHDLILRGDSVMNFRGPTVLGAIVGSLVMIAILVAMGWTTTSTDRQDP